MKRVWYGVSSLVVRGNISTYKELCSLASDLNKPDLVYKFMSLANHNALWNSKKVQTGGIVNCMYVGAGLVLGLGLRLGLGLGLGIDIINSTCGLL